MAAYSNLAPDEDWLERGAALLSRYRLLAEEHTRCGKHRSPKGNLGILRGALEETVAGRELDARRLGLLRHAVASMVRRRGLPGIAGAHRTAARAAGPGRAALPSRPGAGDVATARRAAPGVGHRRSHPRARPRVRTGGAGDRCPGRRPTPARDTPGGRGALSAPGRCPGGAGSRSLGRGTGRTGTAVGGRHSARGPTTTRRCGP
ncbi:hypothetical protein ACRAWF_18805 [Streptomyces sp. L7]